MSWGALAVRAAPDPKLVSFSNPMKRHSRREDSASAKKFVERRPLLLGGLFINGLNKIVIELADDGISQAQSLLSGSKGRCAPGDVSGLHRRQTKIPLGGVPLGSPDQKSFAVCMSAPQCQYECIYSIFSEG